MSTSTKLITAEELFAMADAGPCELIDGEVVPMAPAGAEHGDVAMEIAFRIKAHVKANRLGKVYAAETGFTIRRNPDTTRATDVAFVSRARLPAGPVRGFFEGPPDLAVEVVSPSDRWAGVVEKVEQWLGAGTQSCWVVDPATRTIQIYNRDGTVRHYQPGGTLADEAVLPGFALSVVEAFGVDP